jgi:predicted metal-binding membrane protein
VRFDTLRAMNHAATDPLVMQRRIILALLLILAAGAWALLVWQGVALDMGGMGPTMGLAAPLFLTIWVVMMVAMMFPTAAPMILAFHSIQSGKRARGETFVATWVFVGAYLFVWAISGIVAYAAALAAESIAGAAGLTGTLMARIGGCLLIVAGLYQLSPWKNVCLTKCRTPMSFIITSWHDGLGGALSMGVEHGLYCLGCCWLLFVILFPLGIMNIAAMAVITLLIFAEKSFRWGERIARIAAAALVFYGLIVLFVPAILPTFMAAGGVEVPAREISMSESNTPSPMPEMKI